MYFLLSSQSVVPKITVANSLQNHHIPLCYSFQFGMTQSCEYSSSLYQIRHIQAHKDTMLHVALELLF